MNMAWVAVDYIDGFQCVSKDRSDGKDVIFKLVNV